MGSQLISKSVIKASQHALGQAKSRQISACFHKCTSVINSTHFNISRVTHAASVRELMLIFWCVLYLCSACNIISEEVTEQPVPHSYCLPTCGIPQRTRQALKDKAPINNSMRKDVLQAVYDDITTKYGKFYLSGTEYDIIAG